MPTRNSAPFFIGASRMPSGHRAHDTDDLGTLRRASRGHICLPTLLKPSDYAFLGIRNAANLPLIDAPPPAASQSGIVIRFVPNNKLVQCPINFARRSAWSASSFFVWSGLRTFAAWFLKFSCISVALRSFCSLPIDVSALRALICGWTKSTPDVA